MTGIEIALGFGTTPWPDLAWMLPMPDILHVPEFIGDEVWPSGHLSSPSHDLLEPSANGASGLGEAALFLSISLEPACRHSV